MAFILDGKKARDSYKKALTERSKALLCKPTLALIQIGNNPESSIYIEQKKKFADAIGVEVLHVVFPEHTPETDIERALQTFNTRSDIHGIIIQLPLPSYLNKEHLIETIDPTKDIDGLTDTNNALLEKGTPGFIPATAKGVMSLLSFYDIEVSGKKVVIFGRSRLVGKPIADILRTKGAHVSVCTSKTIDPQSIGRTADILIVAVGKPELIDASYIKEGVTIIDVGINDISGTQREGGLIQRKIVGDVNQRAVETLAKAISPVPGGVGPMTVLSLFDNLILSAENMCRKERLTR